MLSLLYIIPTNLAIFCIKILTIFWQSCNNGLQKKTKKRRRKCKNCFPPRYRSQRQSGSFLSRYDFAYAGRDTVNQAAKHVKTIAPGLINQTMNRVDELAPELVRTAGRDLDMIAARRINQIVHRSGETIQRIAPGIIRGAIEEVYKTPFRLLGQFGRKKYKQLKAKVYRRLRRYNGKR